MLDEYFKKENGMPLRYVCLRILMESTINEDEDGSLIIEQRAKDISELARLITFGDGNMQGSNILKLAFGAGDK